MFSFPWRSTYLQYKEDTDAVASWLAKTARRCGYTGELLNKREETKKEEIEYVGDKQPRAQKSKSKGRKKAKEQAPHPKPDQPPEPRTTQSQPQKPSYLISIPAFTVLAEFIRNSKTPPVSAPNSLVHVLNRAISLRKQFSKSLTDKATLRNDRVDKSHSYFVNVLEQVKKILGNSEPVPSGGYSASDLANSFAGLAVEEPSQEFLDAPAPSPDLTAEPDFKSDQFEDPNEVFLAFKLLIEDFSTIRNAVAQIWEDHLAGKHRSVAAALATNMAIDFARKMEEDMSDMIKRFGGFDQVFRAWWSAICQDRGYNEDYREKQADDMNFRAYEEADAAMFPAYLLLSKFLSLVPSDPKNSPNIGIPGPVNYTSDWKSKTPREKYKLDEVLLNQVLASLTAAIRVPGYRQKGLPGEDELIRGLRVVIETREVSLWNVLSVQILLDIHHCQRQGVQTPWQELEAVGSHLNKTIDVISSELKGMRNPKWPESSNDALRELQKDIEDWVFNDKVQKSILRLKRRAPEKHFHFKNNPVFCGLFTYSLQMRYHILSIDYANTWKAVLHARHLYNAFRQEGLLMEEKWADMELLSLVQPDAIAFAGDAPKRREDYIKRYAIMNGMSAASFSKGSHGPPKRSAAGSRQGIKYQAEFARIFKHRYCDGSGRIDFTPEEVEKVLEKINTYEEETEDKVMDVGWELHKSTHALSKDQTRSRAKVLRRLTIPQLLDRVCSALTGETVAADFLFDYLYLHFESWQMLEMAYGDPDLRATFAPGDMRQKYEMPGVVGYVLAALANDPDTPSFVSTTASCWEMGLMMSPTCDQVKTMLEEQYYLRFPNL